MICSVKNYLLTGIEKVDNEATTILDRKKYVSLLNCRKDICVFFFEGVEGVDDGALVTIGEQNFCFLPNCEIHCLLC